MYIEEPTKTAHLLDTAKKFALFGSLGCLTKLLMMTINLTYEGDSFTARVLYNFKKVSNVIVLLFSKTIYKDCFEMVLTYDPVTNNWSDVEGYHLTNTPLFDQIMFKLRNVIDECECFWAELNKSQRDIKRIVVR